MPDWAEDLRPRLAALRLSPTREAEIIEELAQHLELRYDALRADGVADAEARRLALHELREPEALASHMRTLRQAHVPAPIAPGVPGVPGAPRRFLLADLWQDLRYAARMLRKQPGFTLAAVLTLGLGIGANTAIFSLVNTTLLRTLPVPDREHLAYVHRGNIGSVFSYPMYSALRDGTKTLDAFAAWGGIVTSFNTGDTTDRLLGYIVTGNFFEVLGVSAERGRLISEIDDQTPGAHPVAVISHELWKTRFAGREDIIGYEIRLNGHVFTIIGVTPAGFPGARVGRARHLYVPMMMQPVVRPPRLAFAGEMNPDLLKHPTSSWLFGLGRLKPGTTAAQARGELEALGTHFRRTTSPPGQQVTPVQITIEPVDEADAGERQQMRAAALLLGGVVGAVLLIVCANIASLLLARSASRRRELAVRLAVGASRARLLRQLLTESVLLSTIGGAIGVALAWAVVEAFKAAPPPPGALPLAIDLEIDARVLLFSFALSLLTGLVFGVAPALKASRPGLVPALKDAAGERESGGRRFDLQKTLVIAEVALSMLLLIPAGLFVRSLQAARAIDPGIDVETLVSAPLDINLLRYNTDKGREFYRQVVERVERLPGVESATVARIASLAGQSRVLSFMVEGRHYERDDDTFSEGAGVTSGHPTRINANVVGPRYFDTLGIPLMFGRDFNAQDAAGGSPVVILNETAAKTHFGGSSPLGARISVGGRQGPWREIVGVVRDSSYGDLGEAMLPVVYMPVAQQHETGMTLYLRASVPPASLIASVRREIRALEPNLPVSNVQTVTETVGTTLYAARMGAWLLAAFGGLALLLAAIGIYGVLSFSIARRTREMGIRLALGAKTRDVFLSVVRDGMILVGIGLAIGLIGGFAGARALARFLYGVPTSDVVTFAVTAIVLLTVALAACVVPARRAMRVNPMTALRYD